MKDFLTEEQVKNAFKIAKENLKNNQDLLNNINVFPVADKDTGNNMSLSLARCFDKIDTQETARLVFEEASKTLVLVGMGNSGTILSLFFSGISEYLNNNEIEEISKKEFSEAFFNGAKKIERGLSNPIEGTIMSVARETARIGLENVESCADIEGFMSFLATTAYNELPKTANQNPKLKDFHIIDSGALGFCMILDGFAAGFSGKDQVSREYKVDVNGLIKGASRDSEYKYCTEFVTNVPVGGAQQIQEQLSAIGDCIIPVESDGKLKVHVHTNNPDAALFIGSLQGELQMTKIDNMQQDDGPVKVFYCNEDLNQRCIESMNYENVFSVENHGLEVLKEFLESRELKNIVLITSVQNLGEVENMVNKIRFYESDESLINKLFSE